VRRYPVCQPPAGAAVADGATNLRARNLDVGEIDP
jgi:hypothetical protein